MITQFASRLINAVSNIVVLVLSLLISAYQAIISPLLGPRCRFHPTCSAYALEALKIHGPLFGLWLATKRILSCSGLSAGGIDPVPVKTDFNHQDTNKEFAPKIRRIS